MGLYPIVLLDYNSKVPSHYKYIVYCPPCKKDALIPENSGDGPPLALYLYFAF